MEFNEMNDRLRNAGSREQRVRELAEQLHRRGLAMTMMSARQLAESMVATERLVQKRYQEKRSSATQYNDPRSRVPEVERADRSVRGPSIGEMNSEYRRAQPGPVMAAPKREEQLDPEMRVADAAESLQPPVAEPIAHDAEPTQVEHDERTSTQPAPTEEPVVTESATDGEPVSVEPFAEPGPELQVPEPTDSEPAESTPEPEEADDTVVEYTAQAEPAGEFPERTGPEVETPTRMAEEVMPESRPDVEAPVDDNVVAGPDMVAASEGAAEQVEDAYAQPEAPDAAEAESRPEPVPEPSPDSTLDDTTESTPGARYAVDEYAVTSEATPEETASEVDDTAPEPMVPAEDLGAETPDDERQSDAALTPDSGGDDEFIMIKPDLTEEASEAADEEVAAQAADAEYSDAASELPAPDASLDEGDASDESSGEDQAMAERDAAGTPDQDSGAEEREDLGKKHGIDISRIFDVNK